MICPILDQSYFILFFWRPQYGPPTIQDNESRTIERKPSIVWELPGWPSCTSDTWVVLWTRYGPWHILCRRGVCREGMRGWIRRPCRWSTPSGFGGKLKRNKMYSYLHDIKVMIESFMHRSFNLWTATDFWCSIFKKKLMIAGYNHFINE